MKAKITAVILSFLLISLVFSSHSRNQAFIKLFSGKSSVLQPQDVPDKKPKYDYMKTLLSRDTKPLGLKEDLALKKLLQESSIKWAIRAGKKHILD